jgi:hypothetical protein
MISTIPAAVDPGAYQALVSTGLLISALSAVRLPDGGDSLSAQPRIIRQRNPGNERLTSVSE